MTVTAFTLTVHGLVFVLDSPCRDTWCTGTSWMHIHTPVPDNTQFQSAFASNIYIYILYRYQPAGTGAWQIYACAISFLTVCL